MSSVQSAMPKGMKPVRPAAESVTSAYARKVALSSPFWPLYKIDDVTSATFFWATFRWRKTSNAYIARAEMKLDFYNDPVKAGKLAVKALRIATESYARFRKYDAALELHLVERICGAIEVRAFEAIKMLDEKSAGSGGAHFGSLYREAVNWLRLSASLRKTLAEICSEMRIKVGELSPSGQYGRIRLIRVAALNTVSSKIGNHNGLLEKIEREMDGNALGQPARFFGQMASQG